MAARCYFVPSPEAGQYQWWLERSGGWDCVMWMNEKDGVLRHGVGFREPVPLSYLENAVASRASMVRVW